MTRKVIAATVLLLLWPAAHHAVARSTALHGLVVLIDFSDAVAEVPVEDVEAAVNGVDFSDPPLTSSVRDYWFAQSRGAVDVTHDVVGYYRAPLTAEQYNDLPWQAFLTLAADALDWVSQVNPAFDWDALSLANGPMNRNGVEEGKFLSISFMTTAWIPGTGGTHWLQGWTAPNGVQTLQINAAPVQDPLNLFVLVHEMGHTIWGWPDTYDNLGNSYGTGLYSIMSGWSDGDLQPVGAPFLSSEGWVETHDIGPYLPLVLVPDGDEVARLRNPLDPKEYFIVEARSNTTIGNSAFPVSAGLVIWHVDENVTTLNMKPQMTPAEHYMYSIEQADGMFDLEHFDNQSDAGDIYVPGRTFNNFTTPNSRWWDGSPSNLTIDNIQILPDGRVSFRAYTATLSSVVQNGSFGGLTGWNAYGSPSNNIVHNSAANGIFEFYRGSDPNGQAALFQETGMAVSPGMPLRANFILGNSSPVRKRISVLIVAHDFSDLSVCTFWLPPNMPLQGYQMRTHATQSWSNAAIYFYAATIGENGGRYRIDNVTLQFDPAGPTNRTECDDANAPTGILGITGPNLIVNGAFNDPFGTPWATFSTITVQVTGGVLQFFRPPPVVANEPAGVILQPTTPAAAVGFHEILTARFHLGNTSARRQRVTAILHDQDFSDLAACTFWLAPGQPLGEYVLRTFSSKPWARATWSLYGATGAPAGTELQHQWITVDNVSLRRTPDSVAIGTECIEPN